MTQMSVFCDIRRMRTVIRYTFKLANVFEREYKLVKRAVMFAKADAFPVLQGNDGFQAVHVFPLQIQIRMNILIHGDADVGMSQYFA